ncbi:MAG: heme exporter protein CcmB [Robiginitomaculum sp.]|nr:heme exporter protein CcmB [Robiginitomaculum sp.]
MIGDFTDILCRDLLAARRSGGHWAHGAVFFVMFIMLVAFALGPQQSDRALIASALVWLAACLASQLSLAHLFAPDLRDGTLDCWVSDGRSVVSFVLGKCTAHWILVFIPILLLAPFGALMLGAPIADLLALVLSLVIGGPALILLGGLASALCANLRGGGMLIVLISGPLLAPPLIFGVGAAEAGLEAMALLKILGAISLAAAVFGSFISALALKTHLE